MNPSRINPFQLQFVGPLNVEIEGAGVGDKTATAKATLFFAQEREATLSVEHFFTSDQTTNAINIEMRRRWEEKFETAVQKFLKNTGGGCVKCRE